MFLRTKRIRASYAPPLCTLVTYVMRYSTRLKLIVCLWMINMIAEWIERPRPPCIRNIWGTNLKPKLTPWASNSIGYFTCSQQSVCRQIVQHYEHPDAEVEITESIVRANAASLLVWWWEMQWSIGRSAEAVVSRMLRNASCASFFPSFSAPRSSPKLYYLI